MSRGATAPTQIVNAHILFNVLKMTGGHGVTVGPMLLGAKAPVHVLTPSATVRRIVNMTALVAAASARAATSTSDSVPSAAPAGLRCSTNATWRQVFAPRSIVLS